jgi:Flp pilus assembly protein TadD
MGREPEALKVLKEAEALAPDHPTIYSYLGKAYLKIQDFSSAREALEESIQISPFNPEVHQNLAVAAEKMGDSDTALREREILRRLVR